MTELKLFALDAEDLAVLSAHLQDSVFKVGDIAYDGSRKQLAIGLNRFVWETALDKHKTYERRRAFLSFKRVNAVRSQGFDRNRRDDVLSLLALRFQPDGEGPDGTLELALAGGGSILLEVECIEMQLADVGGAWEAVGKPSHPL